MYMYASIIRYDDAWQEWAGYVLHSIPRIRPLVGVLAPQNPAKKAAQREGARH
jgi:hypothetical protein